MKARQSTDHGQLGRGTLERSAAQIFLVNDRINQMLIEHLESTAWSTRPPISKSSRPVRTIAAIFTHMHNVRCKWIRLTAPHMKVPRQLNRAHCTPKQARVALAGSAARCAEMLAEALGKDGRIRQFRRDGWARPWPAGVEMLCYMLAHEAHHRGQVCMLAHQFGFPLSSKVTSDMWNWEGLWTAAGFTLGPR